MAAQRYPDDWDGILAGSPAVQWTKQLATFAAIQKRLRSSPQNHRGKLIVYVGGADAVISPQSGVAYYQRLMRQMGAAQTQRFARLFVVPGMQHCQGGVSPNAFGQAWIAPAMQADAGHDVRLALEAWVERGRTPASLIAAKYGHDQRGGRPIATQQLRPYPSAASAVTIVRP